MITLFWIYLSFGIISGVFIGSAYFLEHPNKEGALESLAILILTIIAWPYVLGTAICDLLKLR
ncbi:membrane protein [Mycobacterium phage Pound]|nr:membrane protein [Mycobacterium phage Pound]